MQLYKGKQNLHYGIALGVNIVFARMISMLTYAIACCQLNIFSRCLASPADWTLSETCYGQVPVFGSILSLKSIGGNPNHAVIREGQMLFGGQKGALKLSERNLNSMFKEMAVTACLLHSGFLD